MDQKSIDQDNNGLCSYNDYSFERSQITEWHFTLQQRVRDRLQKMHVASNFSIFK